MTEAAILERPAQLAVRASVAELRRVSAWMAQVCRSRGVPADQVSRLDLCLNEAMANIIDHGGDEALAAPVIVTIDAREREVVLVISDGGREFNVLAAPDKAKPTTLADAEPGGLGLIMVRSFSDGVSYRRRHNRNELAIVVGWAG